MHLTFQLPQCRVNRSRNQSLHEHLFALREEVLGSALLVIIQKYRTHISKKEIIRI